MANKVQIRAKLTITKDDLTAEEKALFSSLIRLGDSEKTALWTIEHQERVKPDNHDTCYNAYCI